MDDSERCMWEFEDDVVQYPEVCAPFPTFLQLIAADRPIAAQEADLRSTIDKLKKQVVYWREESYRLSPSNPWRSALRRCNVIHKLIMSFLDTNSRLSYIYVEAVVSDKEKDQKSPTIDKFAILSTKELDGFTVYTLNNNHAHPRRFCLVRNITLAQVLAKFQQPDAKWWWYHEWRKSRASTRKRNETVLKQDDYTNALVRLGRERGESVTPRIYSATDSETKRQTAMQEAKARQKAWQKQIALERKSSGTASQTRVVKRKRTKMDMRSKKKAHQ